MSLLTPPNSSQRDKENRLAPGRVSWCQNIRYHSLGTPPRPAGPSSAKKEPPLRSILKAVDHPILPMLADTSREETPEPEDPLTNLRYLDTPVAHILAVDASLRELIEGYSVLTARLRAVVSEATDADCSWPLFQPIRKSTPEFVDAVTRDLSRAMVDPLAGDEDESRPLLPSPQKSPRKRSGMNEEQVKYARDLCTATHAVLKLLGYIFTVPAVFRVFTDGQLRCMLTQVLAIPLAPSLPTPNARKTCALAIWVLQTQRLPVAVLAPARDRIAYALQRAINGELGKEGKKGSSADGHRAVHDLALHAPALFVPAFEQLLPSVLANLIGPTLNLRAMAAHALGGVALALARLPRAHIHTRVSQSVADFLTQAPRAAAAGSQLAPLDAPIQRALRATLNAVEPVHAAQGPVWALCVLASFIVMLGPALCTSTKLMRVVSALVTLSARHRKASVRGITALLWRPMMWVFLCPPLLPGDVPDDDAALAMEVDGEEHEELSPQEEVKRVGFWGVIKTIQEMGAGVAVIGALLAHRSDNDQDLGKIVALLKRMVSKNCGACRDAMEITSRLVGAAVTSSSPYASNFDSEDAPAQSTWSWNKLLPPGLFSAHPGLLTADFTMLQSTVRSIQLETPCPDDVRPLTRTELASPGIFDGLFEIWREGLARLNLASNAQLPTEFIDSWKGMLFSAVSMVQDSEDAQGMILFTTRVSNILCSIIVGTDINFIPMVESPHPDDDLFPNPALHRHARSNAAMKLSVVRDLWALATHIIPIEELGVGGEHLLAFIMQKEDEAVCDSTTPDDARCQWALLCAEVLVKCRDAPLKMFWGADMSKKWTWEWTDDVRSAVWRTFCERWREIGASRWENALFLLGVPFSDATPWEMSSADLDAWEAMLKFCIDRALDDGVETVRILDHVASILSSTHIPSSSSSTRVADLLLSHLEIDDAADAPATLLEFVNDTLVSTYPPEPRGKVVSMWLLRTVTRIVDVCPLSLFQDVVGSIQEGLQTWIADEYRVFTEEEYSFDVLPVYQTLAVCMQSLGPSVRTLNALAPLLESGFLGRDDKPESMAQAFWDLWETTFAGVEVPAQGWPKRLMPYIPDAAPEVHVNVTQSAVAVVDTYDSDRKDSDVELPGSVEITPVRTPRTAPIVILSEGPLELPIVIPSLLPASPIGLSHVLEPPSTPKASISAMLSLPPAAHQTHLADDLLVPRVPITLFATPLRSPRTPRRAPSSGDKENASPRPVIASVLERIAMQSPATSPLGKRHAVDSLSDERPMKKGRLVEPESPTRGRGAAIAFPATRRSSDSDSDDERRAVERDLFKTPSPVKRQPVSTRSFYSSVSPTKKLRHASPSPSPTPVRKRRGIFMEAVEVLRLSDVRRLQRRESMQTVERQPRRQSLRRVKSLGVSITARKTKMRTSSSAGRGPSSSSPLRVLEAILIAGSDDSISTAMPLTTPATAPPSSDDDPHVGQVTPDHLVSPGMRRPWYMDPPSDDSAASDSPSRAHVARRVFQRLGSGSLLPLGPPRFTTVSTEGSSCS
ncbi:hypothetical protein FA95DRAFT_1681450 [Auriscalpium vulgare]|uniref:Uncharacterized protein n=1 Tax=Auriscalpium vulgare TaxID=40419 RepID=A0ACB8RJN6_9AGAM|nr:hypothetical protein FA95DRAFT_1681450 [Auriscalpium vulgare]